MRKILVLMVLFSTLLFSAEVANLLKAQYKDGVKSYKAKDFKNSYDIFSKLYLSNLSDSKLNFYLGRSAYEIGEYEAALAAFERVEMLDPTSLRNRLEMARTYYMLKMYEDAEIAFKDVLDNPNIPQNVRTNIELYLANVSNVQKRSFTYASVKIDRLYDSNVNYGTDNSSYNMTIGTFPTRDERSDMAFEVFGGLTNVYDIGSKGGFAIKNKINAFLKAYDDEEAYDIQYIGYTPSLIYKETKYLFELSLGYDLLTIGGRKYLNTLWAMPNAEYNHTNTLKSLVHFKYQRKKFSRISEYDLNARHYELAYSLQKILNPRSYILSGAKVIKEKKEHGKRIDVDYNEYRISVAYANQITPTYGMNLFSEFRNRKYKDSSALFFNDKRDDKAVSFSGSINAKILPTFLVHLKGTYDKVKSSQKVFSYDKYTITLGVNKTF